MKSLEEHLIKRESEGYKEFIKHPRFKAIDFIYQRVNWHRVREGYKPLTKGFIAIKTAHCTLEDLDFLVKRMGQSTQPGKVFFGSLKTIK